MEQEYNQTIIDMWKSPELPELEGVPIIDLFKVHDRTQLDDTESTHKLRQEIPA
jgi:hypothetical protein